MKAVVQKLAKASSAAKAPMLACSMMMASAPEVSWAPVGVETPPSGVVTPTEETCGICQWNTGSVRLWCDHAFCPSCLTSADKYGHRSCPICRVPHLLSIEGLQENRMQFRMSYRNWRKGGAPGSCGEVSDVSGYPGWRMGVWKPPRERMIYSSLAGLLFESQSASRGTRLLRADKSLSDTIKESAREVPAVIMDSAPVATDDPNVVDVRAVEQDDAPFDAPKKDRRNILFITADQVRSAAFIRSPRRLSLFSCRPSR